MMQGDVMERQADHKVQQFETMVRVYRRYQSYRADARTLAEHGWSVASVTNRYRRPSLGRYLLLGAFAFWLRGKPEIVVTYLRLE